MVLTLLAVGALVVLALVLLFTSERPMRWRERRYWRRRGSGWKSQ